MTSGKILQQRLLKIQGFNSLNFMQISIKKKFVKQQK